jgi:preprotein translocase subunit SecA
MKSFLTTLDLVMQDKVDPETVVEEDEIEETLTINEDGEIVDENWLTDKLKSAWKKKEADPTHWSNASKSKEEKSHMKLSRKMQKQMQKDIDNDNSEEDESTLMGGKYDESVEQEWNDFNKVYENIKQANELKVLSGQQLDEAFTKQHFELFADMLKNISDNDTRNDYADRLVAMFAKDNPRFDKETFLKAAGVWTADEKTELVYDEHGSVHQIRPSEVDAFLQGHPGRGLAESV